jgi:hypothetical protein
MVVYEVYRRNKNGEYELIGILPERRIGINKSRVTPDSLREWLKKVLDDSFDIDEIGRLRSDFHSAATNIGW